MCVCVRTWNACVLTDLWCGRNFKFRAKVIALQIKEISGRHVSKLNHRSSEVGIYCPGALSRTPISCNGDGRLQIRELLPTCIHIHIKTYPPKKRHLPLTFTNKNTTHTHTHTHIFFFFFFSLFLYFCIFSSFFHNKHTHTHTHTNTPQTKMTVPATEGWSSCQVGRQGSCTFESSVCVCVFWMCKNDINSKRVKYLYKTTTSFISAVAILMSYTWRRTATYVCERRTFALCEIGILLWAIAVNVHYGVSVGEEISLRVRLREKNHKWKKD